MNNEIGPKGCEAICKVLKGKTPLTELNLGPI